MATSREFFYTLHHIQTAATETQDPNPLHMLSESSQLCDITVNDPIVLGFQIATLIDSEMSRLDGSRALVEGRDCADYGSSYCDIRYLRPAHSNEVMRITVKPGVENAGEQTQASHRGTVRFLLSGQSGVAASGLRRTSDEEINLPSAFAACELAIDETRPVFANAPNVHYQQEQINSRAGCRFLQASLGSSLVSGQPLESTASIYRATADITSSSVPKMYPVALSSKMLARCRPFVDIDLTRKSLMYSRLKLHFNCIASNAIRDGDSLDYLVSSKALMASQHKADQGKMIVHVLACTRGKQLVFWGTYTLSVVDATRRYESPTVQRINSIERTKVASKSEYSRF